MAGFDLLIAALEHTVALRPDHPRAWAELAVARMDRFGLTQQVAGRTIGVVDLRQAAGGGRFQSRAELRSWVKRAAGPAVTDLELALEDAREAVRVAPLSGDAWCVLGQLAFLEGGGTSLAGTCVAQALNVRPTSATVIFEAANQALLDGDAARAIELWRSSFVADPRQRGRIISILLPRVSAADACELLEPDLDGLRAIDAAWTPRESADQLAVVRGRRLEAVLARAAESPGGKRCTLLQEAAGLQVRLGQTAAARRSLEQSAAADPSSYEAHLALADLAITMRDGETARAELEWCLLRRPDSQALRARMEKLAKLVSIREAQQQPHANLPNGKLQKL
jgi:tetratricopeptide (TPR) repeat protein